MLINIADLTINCTTTNPAVTSLLPAGEARYANISVPSSPLITCFRICKPGDNAAFIAGYFPEGTAPALINLRAMTRQDDGMANWWKHHGFMIEAHKNNLLARFKFYDADSDSANIVAIWRDAHGRQAFNRAIGDYAPLYSALAARGISVSRGQGPVTESEVKYMLAYIWARSAANDRSRMNLDWIEIRGAA